MPHCLEFAEVLVRNQRRRKDGRYLVARNQKDDEDSTVKNGLAYNASANRTRSSVEATRSVVECVKSGDTQLPVCSDG